MDVRIFIAAVVMLFVILGAAGAVVAFAWNLYIKIMASINQSASGVHNRINTMGTAIADVDKRVAVLEDRGGSE